MKHLFTMLIVVFSITMANSQDLKLNTESIEIDNIISFIADYFPASEEPKDNTTNSIKNTLFLIETSTGNFSEENKIVLQQSFKFLSKRLTTEDTVTIVVYSGQNGVLLERTSAKDIKGILHALSDIKSNIIKQPKDGITLAYKMAQEQFSKDAMNTIIIVRNPNRIASNKSITPELLTTTKVKTDTKPKNNAVLLTAITLLPELIAIIKE